MTCTIEKVLSDARLLVNRLRDHDNSADNLISQSQTLQKRVEAMKQYQEDLNELNEVARHRPRSSLIINLLQENTQIRELQQENKELRMSLEEHQSALELIMTKYRQQILKLVFASKLDKQVLTTDVNTGDAQEKIDKICEMAFVMQRSITIDDEAVAREQQLVSQLKLENNTLREILHIAVTNSNLCKAEVTDSGVQTDVNELRIPPLDVTESDEDVLETSGFNSSIISYREVEVPEKTSDPQPAEEDHKEIIPDSETKSSENEVKSSENEGDSSVEEEKEADDTDSKTQTIKKSPTSPKSEEK